MKTAPKKLVVVGAGQIGTLIAQRLVARGDDVVVVSRSPHTIAGARHVARDLLTDAIDDVVAGAEAVFVAVNSPYSAKVWAQTLPRMQERVVDAAVAAGAKLVVLENLYVHGPQTAPLREDTPFSTSTKKGAVREQMTRALFARAHELRVAAVRPPDFWGPSLHGALLDEKALRGIVAGKAVQAVGDLDVDHARAYVDDVARAMVAIADTDDTDGAADVWGRVWHPPVIHASTRAMVRAVAAAAGVKDPGVKTLPGWAVAALGVVVPFLKEMHEMLYQWDRPYLVDDSAFRARFGFGATSLDDGARACAASVTAAQQRAA